MYRPSFQFYPGDWRRDEAIQLLSLAARGLWIEMMCVMHSADPYGHLVVNGCKVSIDELARLVRAPKAEVKRLLADLERLNVYSLTEEGVIFSRRMVRDEVARCKRAAGGQLGAEHGHKGASFGLHGGRPPCATSIDRMSQRSRERTTDLGSTETPHAVGHSGMERGVIKPPSDPPPSSSYSSSASPSSQPVCETWTNEKGTLETLDAAGRLVGWTEEEIDRALTRVAETAGLALPPSKRKAAHTHIVRWLQGWESIDLEVDVISPIRSFLRTHDGPTHSLARFDKVILDRKARALPKSKATTNAPVLPHDGEGAREADLRAKLRNELGDRLYAAWLETAHLSLDGAVLTVDCPGSHQAEYLRDHHLHALRSNARAVGGSSTIEVVIKTERKP